MSVHSSTELQKKVGLWCNDHCCHICHPCSWRHRLGQKWQHSLTAVFSQYFLLQASYATEVLFASDWWCLGCSHFGSLCTTEEQKNVGLWRNVQPYSWHHRLGQNGSAHSCLCATIKRWFLPNKTIDQLYNKFEKKFSAFFPVAVDSTCDAASLEVSFEY